MVLFISRLKMRNFKSFKAADVQMPPTFICFAGPNGSGKCVDGDTEVLLADGTTSRIRDLVDAAMDNGFVERIDDGYIAQHRSPAGIISLDTKTLRMTKREIGAFVKREAPKRMLNVKTRSGRTIKATEYHPFFILDKGEVKPIRADQLKEKVRVAIPRMLPIETKDTLFLELLDLITPDDRIYVPYDEGLADAIKANKGERTWAEIEGRLAIPEDTLTSFVASKQAMAFPYLVRLLRSFGIEDLEIAQAIPHVKGMRTDILRMPWQNSEEFSRFLGYLLSEGSISRTNKQVRIVNGSEEVVRDITGLAERLFGLKVFSKKYKRNAYGIIINSAALQRLLLHFGMSYEGARGKRIPDLILKHSTNEQLSHLLNGLYSGDGYVSKNSVEITLKSERLIGGIELILLRLGIVPRRKTVSKRETRSGFVGSYSKLSFSAVEDMRRFQRHVPLVHKMKRERLEGMVSRKSNPNVDLIESNDLIKGAVRELGINVKRARKGFPRLDAYCYDQCLPSRSGVDHLLKEVLRPIAIQKSKTEAIERLELVANSDIFWDEIEEIEAVEPGEKWVYDLCVPGDHNFVANGIIVHNSNVMDGVRFAMGETSLKSLRAKKVKELIHAGAKSAEVTMLLESEDGKTKYEIKRAIREDGKILYKLNGKKTTRTSILETLKRHNLDESGRNTIAQGEVARIINMNGKERRLIIDSVAGIADFEEKKKEALRELDTVETRIKDAKLVLGERKAFLDELERERETALRYKDSKKTLVDAKGSLLQSELRRLEKSLESELKGERELTERRDGAQKRIADVEKEIHEVEEKRSKTSEELQSKQKTNAMIRRLEELKASTSSKEQLIEDKLGFISRAEKEAASIKDDIGKEKEAVAAIEREVAELAGKLKTAEAELSEQGGMTEDDRLMQARKRLEESEKELSALRERRVSLDSELQAKKEIIQSKREEQESILPGAFEEEEGEDADALRKEVNDIAAEIDRLFSKTKEINAEIAELDREMLELKEKASIFKVRSSPQLANPALSFISDLAKTKGSGIHGTLADLITFEPKHAAAVEAAAGSRLLYVVVDDIDVATSVIDKLKKAKAGRATFIPLDKVRAPQGIRMDGYPSVLEVIDFPERIRAAAHYVFSETLLVDDVGDAKSLGIGKARMVTLDGEIFERSGIVSGGRAQSGILSGNQLRKIENELSEAKSSKESLIQELYSIREEESGLRAKKSQVEIRIKSIEMQRKMDEDRRKENEGALQRKERLGQEIGALERSVSEREEERKRIEGAIMEKAQALERRKADLSASEDEYRKSTEESSRKRASLSGKVSELRATIEGKQKELEIRNEEMDSNLKRAGKLEEERKEAKARIKEIHEKAKEEEKELKELEGRISSASKTIEKLFERMKGLEEELVALGKRRGEIRIELDKAVRELNQLEVKKATTTTRLEDIKAEFDEYREVEFIDASKEELSRMIREAESTLSGLGDVNMAAIEMYEKKKAELEGVEDKIDRLDKEREAIMAMIEEIEEHKKEAFFETFNAVSENFSSLFKHINIGQGHLYLNNPTKPFESGLFIKLRRGNQEHSLDALSGGEKTLVALMFIFALQFYKPAPFYILDEVDAALDKPNSKNLADLVAKTAKDSQFILVSHNDTVMANSETVIGVTKVGGVSKLVGIKLKQVAAA